MGDISCLRTPQGRFENLPDWPFAPNYTSDLEGYEGLLVHYVDEGPKDAKRTYLCLHGQPTWSYLYRKMIPVFLESGGRVVAPDWLGFGRSDKPVEDSVYGFHFHRSMMLAFIRQLDLKNITLVVQDWGGLLGLTLPHEIPDRFNGLLIMNTVLAMGKPPSQEFLDWRAYVAANPDFNIGGVMKRSTPILSEAEIEAYNAPFPDMSYKAGARRFPAMVMVEPQMEGVQTSLDARQFWSNQWQGETFMAIGAADPVLGTPVMQAMRSIINGCPEPMVIEEAGHFVQEWGKEIAERAVQHFE